MCIFWIIFIYIYLGVYVCVFMNLCLLYECRFVEVRLYGVGVIVSCVLYFMCVINGFLVFWDFSVLDLLWS